ncbi:MAG: hypothetical protein IJ680_03525 [Paludibacteraceae bacterium]|nr:hypothetical protein [Paludibacteraceae bacterium]
MGRNDPDRYEAYSGEAMMRKHRYIAVLLMLLTCQVGIFAGAYVSGDQHSARTQGEKIPIFISMSLQEYEDTIRSLMRRDRWTDAKKYLDAADLEWGYTSVFCYLNGRYWNHKGDNNIARRYLLRAMKDDNTNTEALELLLKIEEVEKNYATAIVHVNDLLTFSPYNIRLWRKKIELYRLNNNDTEADRLLDRLATIYPENEQVKNDIVYRKEQLYQEQRKRGSEQEAQQTLRDLIVNQPTDPQYYLDLSGSLLKEGKTQEALEICAKGVNNTHGNRQLIRRRVSILTDCAFYQDAENYLDDCIRLYGNEGLENLRRDLQLEIAQATDRNDVYSRYRRLYGTQHSDDALDWLIRTSMQRGYWDDAQFYISEARKAHGDSRELLAKAYLTELRLGNDRRASRLLEERYVLAPDDEEVREMIAEKRLRTGTDLMQDELWQDALDVLRQADSLTMDDEQRDVIQRRIRTCISMLPDTTRTDSLGDDWMMRSIHYERLHEYDSAYACIMRYQPSLNEYHYVTRHRYLLESRTLKNNLSLEYQYARRSSLDQLNHNAYITYSHAWKHDGMEVSAAYAGRESSSWTEETDDGADTTIVTGGGTGVQFGLGYSHYYTWGDLSVQASWANRFLPKGTAKVAVSENLSDQWTLTERISWRYIDDELQYHLWALGASAEWTAGQFYLTPGLDAYLMEQHVYANAGLKMQFFPLDGDRSHLFTSVGVGNAPDLTLLDNSLPIRFANLNTNVSAGGYYTVNGHLGLSASLSWYVMGNNDKTVRNYLYLNLSMNIGF